MENEIGSIKEGCYADLILLDKNPLQDIRVLSKEENIKSVLKSGIWYKRGDI
jgi:imidazolonepropionase-like amidohydrolase